MWGDWDHVDLNDIDYGVMKPKMQPEDPINEGFLKSSTGDSSVLVFDQTDDLGIFLCDYS